MSEESNEYVFTKRDKTDMARFETELNERVNSCFDKMGELYDSFTIVLEEVIQKQGNVVDTKAWEGALEATEAKIQQMQGNIIHVEQARWVAYCNKEIHRGRKKSKQEKFVIPDKAAFGKAVYDLLNAETQENSNPENREKDDSVSKSKV